MILTEMFCVFLIFELITVPLYLRIIFVLIRQGKKFAAPFYKFLIVLGFSNLLNYSVVFSFYLLAMYPPTSQLIGFAKLPAAHWIGAIRFIIYYTAYQQDFLHLSISLNRFTSVWMPIGHNRIWDKWLRPHMLIAFILPIPFSVHLLFSIGQFVPLVANETSKGLIPAPIQFNLYYLDQSVLTIVMNGLCLFVCLALNMLTLFKIIWMRRSGKMKSLTTQGQSVELNLLVLVILMTLILSTSLLFQLGMYLISGGMILGAFVSNGLLNKTDAMNFLYAQLPWVNDIRVLSQPWALVAVSKECRKAVLPCLDYKRPREWKTIVSVLPQSSKPVTR